MKPPTGNFSMLLDRTAAAGSYFPLDGKGSTVLTSAGTESFVKATELSVITQITCPSTTGGAQLLQVFHGDGTRAATAALVDSSDPPLDVTFAGDGLLMQGDWYVTIDAAGSQDDWLVLFRVL